MDSILGALALHHIFEINWYSEVGLDEFISYKFVKGTVQSYSPKGLASMKRQMVDDGPFVPVLAPIVDVNQLPGMARNSISYAERNYRRCCSVID